MNIESAMMEYEKIGNRGIFQKYFKLLSQMNTNKFCDIVDALPDKQPQKCSVLYGGPPSQGLAGGFSTLISFAEFFTTKIESVNLNNFTEVDALLNDDTFENIRIFKDMMNYH